jgi:hypothetical protein
LRACGGWERGGLYEYANTFSMRPIQDVARWQFMRQTQSPFLPAASITWTTASLTPPTRPLYCVR